MPVDLRALPEKRLLPAPLLHGRWCLLVLLCAVALGTLIVLLWPQGHWRATLWFWCCVVVLPVLPGLLIYAVRLLSYERTHDYARSWNQSHEEQKQVLIRQGQRFIGLLATSYCSGVGNHQIALALRRGSKSLQPVYLDSLAQTMRLSQIMPHAQEHTRTEYSRRLTMFLRQVLVGLEPDLQCGIQKQPLRVRIRHNQVLDDDEVLALWHSVWRNKRAVDEVFFATRDDGLLWLDTWLDEPGPYRYLLSLEINLFREPIVEQAESVSIVLLAFPEVCAAQGVTPIAWIHRPVSIVAPAIGLQDAFCWGRILSGDNEHFIWFSQMPADALREVNAALSAAGYPVDIARRHSLDDSFGLPGCAVGNVALILASEQASADRQAQVVILQDVSPQALVVQPSAISR
jgi:hypothetical protein